MDGVDSAGQVKAASPRLAIVARTLYLLPTYRQAYHRLVRPDHHQILTEYFRRHWAPRLGPTRTMVILQLRGLALAAGPDGVEIRETDLAALCGVSESTVFRTLKHSALRPFVEKVRRREYRRQLGRVVQAPNLYLVVLDDPVLPEHEPLMTSAAATMQDLPRLGASRPPTPLRQMSSYPPSDRQTDGLEQRYPPPDPHRDGRASSVGLNLRAKTFQTNIPQTLPNDAANVYEDRGSHGEQEASRQLATMVQGMAADEAELSPAQRRAPRRRDLLESHPEWRPYVERAEQVLDDTHSRGFYIKALRALAAADALSIWERALGLAREQRAERIRRSRAALFTALLKQFAREAGIRL